MVQAVEFLLDVGQLGVTKTAESGAFQQGGGQAGDAGTDLFLAAGLGPAKPAGIRLPGVHAGGVRGPIGAAVLAHEKGLAAIVMLAGTLLIVAVWLAGLQCGVAPAEHGGVLLIIVQVVQVGDDMVKTAGVDDRPGRVERFGEQIDVPQDFVVLGAARMLEGNVERLIEGAPADQGRVAVVPLQFFQPRSRVGRHGRDSALQRPFGGAARR